MDNSNLHKEALLYTVDLLNQGATNVLDKVRKEYSSGQKQMSEGQWDWYYDNALPAVLERARADSAVRGFVSEFSLLDGTALQTALEDDEVSIENLSIVMEKMKEECLKAACRQDYDGLLAFFLQKDKSLANFKFFDGSYILHYAAQFGSLDVVKTLLLFDAVVECEDNDGQNFLHYAAKNSRSDVWKELSTDPKFAKLAVRKNAFGQDPIDLYKNA